MNNGSRYLGDTVLQNWNDGLLFCVTELLLTLCLYAIHSNLWNSEKINFAYWPRTPCLKPKAQITSIDQHTNWTNWPGRVNRQDLTSPPSAGAVSPPPHDWRQSNHSQQGQQSSSPISAPYERLWPTNVTAAWRLSAVSRRRVRRCRSRGLRRDPFRRCRLVWCR